jgi:hypothetical protein
MTALIQKLPGEASSKPRRESSHLISRSLQTGLIHSDPNQCIGERVSRVDTFSLLNVGQSGRTKSATRTEQAGNSEAPPGSTAMDPKSSQIHKGQGGKKLSGDFSGKHEKYKGQGRRRDSGNAQNHTVRDSRMTTEYHPNKLRKIARDELYGHGTQSEQSDVDSYNEDWYSIDLSPRALAVRTHSWDVRDVDRTASNLPSPTLETVDPASDLFDDNTSKSTRFLTKAILIYDALKNRLQDKDMTSTNDAGWMTDDAGWETDY